MLSSAASALCSAVAQNQSPLAGSPPPLPEVMAQVESLANYAEELTHAVDALDSRLRSVIRATPASQNAATGAECGCSSPLGEAIRKTACVVSGNVSRVREILSTLAI